ncbi:MAG: hypothetical protein AAB152_11950 [Candidatus Coatesbacteria bacterium]
MTLYPNRSQWITIWLTAALVAAAIGQHDRRATVACAMAGALRAWQQAKAPGRSLMSLAGNTLLTVVILVLAWGLAHPK